PTSSAGTTTTSAVGPVPPPHAGMARTDSGRTSSPRGTTSTRQPSKSPNDPGSTCSSPGGDDHRVNRGGPAGRYTLSWTKGRQHSTPSWSTNTSTPSLGTPCTARTGADNASATAPAACDPPYQHSTASSRTPSGNARRTSATDRGSGGCSPGAPSTTYIRSLSGGSSHSSSSDRSTPPGCRSHSPAGIRRICSPEASRSGMSVCQSGSGRPPVGGAASWTDVPPAAGRLGAGACPVRFVLLVSSTAPPSPPHTVLEAATVHARTDQIESPGHPACGPVYDGYDDGSACGPGMTNTASAPSPEILRSSPAAASAFSTSASTSAETNGMLPTTSATRTTSPGSNPVSSWDRILANSWAACGDNGGASPISTRPGPSV